LDVGLGSVVDWPDSPHIRDIAVVDPVERDAG